MQKLQIVLLFIFLTGAVVAQNKTGALKVTPNGHYLQYEDGRPFFWLGDTAWELFHRLTLDEIKTYLNNRQAKGFNVIQAVILAELDGLRVLDRYGQAPLVNMDPEKPNEEYFARIDSVVRMAAERNMIMALLPTWGDKVTLHFGGKGPVIFTKENAYTYGAYLGKRYSGFSNIVWVLGGDRPPKDSCNNYIDVYRSMAKGIREGSKKHRLTSFHPGGLVWESSLMVHNEEWLDFNMIQSGHGELDQPVWKNILRDRKLKPVKPTLDAEPCYEDIPVNPWNWDPSKGYFRDYEMRKQLYRSVFAGGCGVTYGNHSIWQMYSPVVRQSYDAERYWYEALDRPGAFQAGYLKKLIESRPYLHRIPDTSIITKGQGTKADYITAFRDSAGRYMMVYIPEGKTITVNTSFIAAKKIKVTWFDPKTGRSQKAKTLSNKQQMSFTTPAMGKGNDWVLIIDKS